MTDQAAAAPRPAATALSEQILSAPPFPVLLRLATPNAMAFFVQAAVSMAEVAFVGRLGTVPLAAIALMFPGLMLMQMLANGAIGGAVSSAIARSLGAGKPDRAAALIWHALVISLVSGLLFLIAWHAAGASLLDALGANPAVSSAASEYADVLFGGAVLVWAMALLSSVLRGMGNMKLPAMLMMIGACVQIPLSGTLMLGWFGVPAMGLTGSAVALLVVAAVNTVVLLVRLQRSDSPVRLEIAACRLQGALFTDIFRVGALAALSPIFVVLTIGMINGLISGFGVAALAGYGIVARLEFLLIPMVFGLGAAMTAMVGTNMGAGNVARAEHIGWLGGLSAAVVTGVVGLLLAVFPGLWLGLFAEDAATWAAGESYLHIVGPVFAFQGLGLSLYFASQGAGTVLWPVIATALRFVIGVGGAVLVVNVFSLGLDAVYVCLAVGMFVYGALTAAAIRLGAWRQRSTW
ncbi:MAG: MATE family efflux transporter [Pseudomonadales bacterium]